MTTAPLIQPFPKPGPSVARCYRELHLARKGSDEEKKSLGDPSKLPRPWIPATCTAPQMRTELWNWLEAAVTWINHELVFDPVDAIPSCWPEHRHLIHEIAVLVDLRHRAETALDSQPLEEWHRYALPAFLERMRHRLGTYCRGQHPSDWPNQGRFARHTSTERAQRRCRAYAADVDALKDPPDDQATGGDAPRLSLVDTESGEIYD